MKFWWVFAIVAGLLALPLVVFLAWPTQDNAHRDAKKAIWTEIRKDLTGK